MKKIMITVVVILLIPVIGIAFFPNQIARMLPGVHSRKLSDLSPPLQSKITAVTKKLDKAGYKYVISTTYRDELAQNSVQIFGFINNLIHGNPVSFAWGGQSCHNRKRGNRPSSTAIDIRPTRPIKTDVERAEFFKFMGKEGKKLGLEWGGDWMRPQSRRWHKFGVGWDPAHLQTPKCQ